MFYSLLRKSIITALFEINIEILLIMQIIVQHGIKDPDLMAAWQIRTLLCSNF